MGPVGRVQAAGEFSTEFDSRYQIDEAGVTDVEHQILLTNLQSNKFVSEYSLAIGGTKIDAIRAVDETGELPISINKTENTSTIIVDLADRPAVGQGKAKKIWIRYANEDIAAKVGKILEVNIPKIENSNEFEAYSITVNVGSGFGRISNVVPNPTSFKQEDGRHILNYEKSDITSGITAVFGTSQIFSLDLTYYLENAGSTQSLIPIALVGDRTTQRVTYSLIEPAPESTYRDRDGNWIAEILLEAQEKKTVTVRATVELFLDHTVRVDEKNLDEHLKPSQYWQTTNSEIVQLAQKLGTPKAIYDFVVEHLDYDYSRVTSGGERLGALEAFKNPDSAICTEFTDLFVTLSRAAGIPAREINGFAYSQNESLRPMALSRDILHAWPEYWDQEEKNWVQVDPTWENTTGGIDYFHKLDFNHIVFVTHGISDVFPVSAGFYKSAEMNYKTVLVEPGLMEIKPRQAINVEMEELGNLPAYRSSSVKIRLKNNGNQAVYNLPFSVRTPYNIIGKELPKTIDWLLPGEERMISFALKPPLIWRQEKSNIMIVVGADTKSYETSTGFSVVEFIVFGILFVAGVGGTILAVRTWHLHLQRRKA